MGKFTKGIALGGLLGAALMWMQTTASGREMKKKLRVWTQEAFDEIKKQAGTEDLLDRAKYHALVARVVQEYKKNKDIPEKILRLIEKILRAQWQSLKK